MRLLLVRHGQTDLNVQKRLQGSSDIPLNARGREQASGTHDFVIEKGILPTKIITSPLGRAIETGCLIAGIDISGYEKDSISATNKPAEVELNQNLIEMSFGIYEKRNTDELEPSFLEDCFDYPERYNPPEGGDNYDEVVARAGALIEEMRGRIKAGEFSENDVVMLVSHGALIHAAFEYIKKTPRSEYWNVDVNNCSIAELFLSTDGSLDDYKLISKGFEKNW